MHFDLQCLPPIFSSRGVCLGGARLGNRTLKRAETRICRMSLFLSHGSAGKNFQDSFRFPLEGPP
jgi:hypothetical protein